MNEEPKRECNCLHDQAQRGTPHAVTCPQREDESPLGTMTPEQKTAREDAVKAIGQRAHALIRYDGVDPALVASALLWCATSMYAQAAEGLTREAYLEACGATWDEAKEFLAALARAAERKIEAPR